MQRQATYTSNFHLRVPPATGAMKMRYSSNGLHTPAGASERPAASAAGSLNRALPTPASAGAGSVVLRWASGHLKRAAGAAPRVAPRQLREDAGMGSFRSLFGGGYRPDVEGATSSEPDSTAPRPPSTSPNHLRVDDVDHLARDDSRGRSVGRT